MYRIFEGLHFLHKILFLCSCDGNWWKMWAAWQEVTTCFWGNHLASQQHGTAGHLQRAPKKKQLPGSAAKLLRAGARSTLLCLFPARATYAGLLCWSVCVCVFTPLGLFLSHNLMPPQLLLFFWVLGVSCWIEMLLGPTLSLLPLLPVMVSYSLASVFLKGYLCAFLWR